MVTTIEGATSNKFLKIGRSRCNGTATIANFVAVVITASWKRKTDTAFQTDVM